MKHFTACLILGLLLANPTAAGQAADNGAVEQTFSQYRLALLEGNGAEAADLVDSRTMALYGEFRANALNMPRQDVAKLDFVSKFIVLRIRHEFSRAQIDTMSGRDLFIIGVERGWISKSMVSDTTRLAEIKVDRHQASASIPQVPGIPAYFFVNEAGRWKLALWRSFEMANAAMRQEVEKSGLTEEQFILRKLGALSAKKVDGRILSGPLR